MFQKKKSVYIVILLLCIVSVRSTFGQHKYLQKWPKGKSPEEIGLLVAGRFVQSAHPNWGNPGPANEITYPETCAWYGALLFAGRIQHDILLKALQGRYEILQATERKLIPKADHVDHTVFGSIPLELYMLTKDNKYLKQGIRYADQQWQLPDKATTAEKDWHDKGFSWQTRLWIDDMFMISTIQAQAYRATGDVSYINRAAREMVMYLSQLQRSNGLFYHADDVPIFWGRGNGWYAAGMAELLRSLPLENPYRAEILAGYQKMMLTLLDYQDTTGMWKQIIDDPTAWNESSGTAMFTYAMTLGVKNGWLEERKFGPVVRKSWLALTEYIDTLGDVSEVCEGTNKKNDKQYYLDRRRLKGDMHGQAPILWTAFALLQNN
ncbi:glycoside hydrolase family 88/105 protein [Sphingobacterium sp. SYP-B4668]|uniref:glycoside hydrolase family 88/105 protein n=1 Tax=Sphingobacterium sp. SYP-B4668 TaxID=2996035 RepID=UPI0022DE213B|nr:glycoside hydrolase family 88 protein [Sphingobacterium sp. SYP-B4668]